jgi:post-segregation antitoxin (ccd killing protein)
VPSVSVYFSDENYEYLRSLKARGMSDAVNAAISVARVLDPSTIALASKLAKAEGVDVGTYIKKLINGELERERKKELTSRIVGPGLELK